MQIKTIVKAFKTHIERLGYSKTSINMLPACVKDFLEYQPHEQLANITSADILNYHKHLQERPNKRTKGGLSESYINHHIYALKLFFQWQLNNKTLEESPISSLEFKTPTSKQREILTQEEIKLLYEATETLKERAILSLFYGCGIRRTEGEKLNLKDIHFRNNMLYVREGKGSKRRAVPLSLSVVKDLKNYVYEERFSKENELALITNKFGKRMRGGSYNTTLKRLLKKAGITKEISLHCLRHSIATHLLESGLSVEYVRDFLGHKNLESTQLYTRVKNKQIWSMSQK